MQMLSREEEKDDKSHEWLAIIQELQKNNVLMEECLKRIFAIVKMYPPRKDENKFHYGKLIEKTLIHYIHKVIPCRELDLETSCGSYYKNDVEFLTSQLRCSVKVSKNGSAITLINKRTRNDHCLLGTCFMICNLKKKKLYFIVHQHCMTPFMKENGAAILYRPTIFGYMEKMHPQFIFNFPITESFQSFQKNILETIPESNFYATELERILQLPV